MVKKFLNFLHSDDGLRLAGVFMTVCYIVKATTTEGGTVNQVASKLLEAGVILGISSTVGRQGKAKAAPEPKE